MRNEIAALRRKLPSLSTPETPEQPTTDCYECPACRSMIIHPASDRCSQCGSATLELRQ